MIVTQSEQAERRTPVRDWLRDPFGMRAYQARSAEGWALAVSAGATVGPRVSAAARRQWRGFPRSN